MQTIKIVERLQPDASHTMYAPRQTQLILPTVHVARFGSGLPNEISIAKFAPRGFVGPELKALAPSRELLALWRASDHSDKAWQDYRRAYWTEIAERCKASVRICYGARELIELGLAMDMRGGCVAYILASAAHKLGLDELTLCCYEYLSDEHCHRKLVFDDLPLSMKGIRA